MRPFTGRSATWSTWGTSGGSDGDGEIGVMLGEGVGVCALGPAPLDRGELNGPMPPCRVSAWEPHALSSAASATTPASADARATGLTSGVSPPYRLKGTSTPEYRDPVTAHARADRP